MVTGAKEEADTDKAKATRSTALDPLSHRTDKLPVGICCRRRRLLLPRPSPRLKTPTKATSPSCGWTKPRKCRYELGQERFCSLLMHWDTSYRIGRPVRLVSNCFDVKLTEQRLKWYKYEVGPPRLAWTVIAVSLTSHCILYRLSSHKMSARPTTAPPLAVGRARSRATSSAKFGSPPNKPTSQAPRITSRVFMPLTMEGPPATRTSRSQPKSW